MPTVAGIFRRGGEVINFAENFMLFKKKWGVSLLIVVLVATNIFKDHTIFR